MRVCEELQQGSQDWLEWRRLHIGASESGAILGINPYSSPIQIWEQKTLGWESPMNDAMKDGHLNEPIARRLYESIKGVKVEPMVAEWDTCPIISASFDGIDIKTNSLVEIKCGRASFRAAKREIVPAYYLCQMQQQMLVADLLEIDYFCYDPVSKDSVLMTIKRDENLIKRIVDANIHFWQHVITHTPPEEKCCSWNCSLTKEI
jgi:putative phage-type endonuclease